MKDIMELNRKERIMNCCLCHSNQKKHLYKLCSNMKILGEHFSKNSSYVSVCEKCGLVFIDTDATIEEFNQYYNSNVRVVMEYTTLYGKQGALQYFEHLYNCIEKYLSKDSFLIDIAGTKGEFVEYLRKEKKHFSNKVLEYSKECIQACRERNLDVVEADIYEEQKNLENTADIVTIIHTLEHFLDVDRVMNNALSMLKDDGILFVEVPDIEGYIEHDEVPYFYLTYEHIVHMSKITLENISRKYGLKLLKLEKYLKGNGKNGGIYPSVYAIYQKGGTKEDIIYDELSIVKAEEYLEKCYAEIHTIMEPYRRSKEGLILWGIGASTAQLLSAMEGCNIVALVDSNPSRQGIEYDINGKSMTIVSPESVMKEKNEDNTILILPVLYKDSIEKQIRAMGLKNKIESLSKRVL